MHSLAVVLALALAAEPAATPPVLEAASPIAAPKLDPKDYPRTFERDGKMCRQDLEGAAIVEKCLDPKDLEDVGASAAMFRPKLDPGITESIKLGSAAHGMGGGFKAIGIVQIVAGIGLLTLGAATQDDKGGIGFIPGAVTLGAGALFAGIGAGFAAAGDTHFAEAATGERDFDAKPAEKEKEKGKIRYGIFDAPDRE